MSVGIHTAAEQPDLWECSQKEVVAWTDMPFAESGEYVFPHGLAPLDVDREADLGAHWEPNAWVRHRVP
jgi:hypothetical protein